MARPARVRILRRNPCLRARRRLFGWYVRLLTTGSSRNGWVSGCRSPGSPVHSIPMDRFDGHRSPTDLNPVSTRRMSHVGRRDNGTGVPETGQTHLPRARHTVCPDDTPRLFEEGAQVACPRSGPLLASGRYWGFSTGIAGDRSTVLVRVDSALMVMHTLWKTMWITKGH